MDKAKYTGQFVFGLDIGTRSIVGTIGYRESTNHFVVVAQVIREHETRAMIDGQIHDIQKVAEIITTIKNELEEMTERKLTEVCIAAAGRVLKTVKCRADYDLSNEAVVNQEHIYSLDMLGVEKAYERIREETKEEQTKYYCVGYSVIRYYLNDYAIMNLLEHKANKIGVELIVTFLPDEVVDGLYSAVEKAGLTVANLTLEPIAAINVAIPDKFRLLNIALVDVGAGTSDISIAKDGSIIAFGMIPSAGDEITETIAKKYLTDFHIAEKIKKSITRRKTVSFKDILGISHKITAQEVLDSTEEIVRLITKDIADRIIELNGEKTVSAVFIVGGGGKLKGFATYLAEYLSLPENRVAIRGAEVLGDVEFLQPGIKKDSTLVTPIGICLNYYEQKNNFIFVTVNGERVKLYDNSKLTIVDAALQIGFPNECLFPKRGNSLIFTVNKKKRLVRGELGEAAVLFLNHKEVGMNTPIQSNDKIEIQKSTAGTDAVYEVSQLPEYESTLSIYFNDKKITCPKFVAINGKLVSGFSKIQDGDKIEILNYYTLKQILEFMDIICEGDIYVNNVLASNEEMVYENFTITYDLREEYPVEVKKLETKQEGKKGMENPFFVVVNGERIELKGKTEYILVDVFDFYSFDISKAAGRSLITRVKGEHADFTKMLEMDDVIQIYWDNGLHS